MRTHTSFPRHAIAAAALLAAWAGTPVATAGTVEARAAAAPTPSARNVTTIAYDGIGDDLLTAGVGKTGLLATSAAPVLSATPSAAELRRLAIVTNYRAIVDTTAGGGFGTLFGPQRRCQRRRRCRRGQDRRHRNAGLHGRRHGPAERDDDGAGASTFNVNAPCIVSATSSGSRGVYGAIGSAGEWGLKHGCAVAYTDKGTGNGVHDLQADTVNLIDGRRTDAATAGTASNFTARLSAAERKAFNAATPNRFAVKHAHSEQNPEKDWGRHTLDAIEFAFWVLNERLADVLPGAPPHPRDQAGQHAGDRQQRQQRRRRRAGRGRAGHARADRRRGRQRTQHPAGALHRHHPARRPAALHRGQPAALRLLRYSNLLQPCAALATAAAGSPFGYTGATAFVAGNRCAVLAAAGLVSGATTQAQADDALARLQAYGYEPEGNLLHASMWLFATPAIAVTYANTYGRFRVSDNVCGFSFGAVDANSSPTPAAPASIAGIFSTGNGVPPSGVIQIIYNDSVGGAKNHTAAVSPSTNAFDFAYDGAACLRALWTGSSASATRTQAGIAEVYRTANLHGKPAIVVQGRSDTLIAPNFSSRPYILRNTQVEGAASQLRYIEVANGQHFDSFLPLAGYDNSFIPLHLYFVRAMDAMWAHLKNGAALPPSQLVRTTPRGGAAGAANAITAANVPAIAASPAPGDLITVTPSTLTLPD